MKILNLIMRKRLIALISILALCACEDSTTDLDNLSISEVEILSPESVVNGNVNYRKNVKVVLADFKQLIIKGTIKKNNIDQMKKLLDAYKKLKVQGVRVPIFPDVNSTQALRDATDEVIKQARAKNFKVYANPAEWQGGRRIANKIWQNSPHDVGPSVNSKPDKRDVLINRIVDFARTRDIHWISPFNEDALGGSNWAKAQTSKIFERIDKADGNQNKKVHGVTLMGPDSKNIDAAINMIDQTDVEKYANSIVCHNLGFRHDDWSTMQTKAGNKWIWDSETYFGRKDGPGNKERIQAAVDENVEGLIIYNSHELVKKNNSGKFTADLNDEGKRVLKIYFNANNN